MIIKKQIIKFGFTLIELMITITIIVVLTMMTYAPYNYYQNKAKLKITLRQVSQLLYESRNMAVNWAVWTSWNISIWVYFDNSSFEKNIVKVFSYPHDIDIVDINNIEWWDIKLLQTITLQDWIQIDYIDTKPNMLFVFDAITWNLKYYTWKLDKRENYIDNDNQISINFSYKWSNSDNLKKEIIYFTSTNIIDY